MHHSGTRLWRVKHEVLPEEGAGQRGLGLTVFLDLRFVFVLYLEGVVASSLVMLCSGASWTLPGGGPPRGLIGAILPSVESPLRRSCTFDGSSDHALYPTVPCPVDERDVGLVLICAKAQRKSTCPLASLRCTTREAARGRAMDVLAGQTSLMSADGRPAVVVLLLFVLFLFCIGVHSLSVRWISSHSFRGVWKLVEGIQNAMDVQQRRGLCLTLGHWCFGKRPPVCGIRLQRRLATGAVFSTTGRERRSRSDSVAFVDTVGGLIFVVVFGSSGHRVMVFPSSFCRDKLPGFGNHSGHLAGLLFRPIRVIGRGCCFASFGSSVGLLSLLVLSFEWLLFRHVLLTAG